MKISLDDLSTPAAIEEQLAESKNADAVHITVDGRRSVRGEPFSSPLGFLADVRRRGLELTVEIVNWAPPTRGNAPDLPVCLAILHADDLRIDGRRVEDRASLLPYRLDKRSYLIGEQSATALTNTYPDDRSGSPQRHSVFDEDAMNVNEHARVLVDNLQIEGRTAHEGLDLSPVLETMYQGADNVLRHVLNDDVEHRRPGVHYVHSRLVSWHDVATADGAPDLSTYISGLSSHRDPPQHLLEISIADSGRGIVGSISGAPLDDSAPASQSKDKTWLTHALTPGGSRFGYRKGVGYGFSYVALALWRLRGFLYIRANRVATWRSFLSADGTADPALSADSEFAIGTPEGDKQMGHFNPRHMRFAEDSQPLALTTGSYVGALIPIPTAGD